MHFTSRQTLLDWVRRGRLAQTHLPAALALCDLPPASARWQWLFDRLLLWLGSLCLGAGLVFFVAFNWQELGRVSRLALLELPLLAMLVLLWRKPMTAPPARHCCWPWRSILAPCWPWWVRPTRQVPIPGSCSPPGP
ncbi:hypothetical protein ASA01S_034_00080 [Aeromonas salmonicida subsp. masoucida NBRC 13784]|nr:hypothetical protein ASA01S_034_00080 [Aeromonas salmonicida subsp. masoucida NBRC 13784]